MSKNRQLIVPAVVLGIVLILIAVIYFVNTAHGLPSFFPGHSSTPTSHHHTKHGIAALILGLLCFVFAWFQTGPAPGARGPAGPAAA